MAMGGFERPISINLAQPSLMLVAMAAREVIAHHCLQRHWIAYLICESAEI